MLFGMDNTNGRLVIKEAREWKDERKVDWLTEISSTDEILGLRPGPEFQCISSDDKDNNAEHIDGETKEPKRESKPVLMTELTSGETESGPGASASMQSCAVTPTVPKPEVVDAAAADEDSTCGICLLDLCEDSIASSSAQNSASALTGSAGSSCGVQPASFKMPCCGAQVHLFCIAELSQLKKAIRQNCAVCQVALSAATEAAVRSGVRIVTAQRKGRRLAFASALRRRANELLSHQ